MDPHCTTGRRTAVIASGQTQPRQGRPMPDTISSIISPEGSLEILSQHEVSRLHDTSRTGLHDLLRRCTLAVLNCGSPTDDSVALMEAYRDFDIEVIPQDRGIRLKLTNAPAEAFVDGRMIRGIREHLSSVLRDIVYVYNEIQGHQRFDLSTGEGTTNAVFHILRKAGTLKPGRDPSLVVCWGGHSISREEYEYSKDVGYHLGLRELDICTGCGPGAMKGPMKGANVAHAKQRRREGRYLGISEPGIIAAHAPNPIVNELLGCLISRSAWRPSCASVTASSSSPAAWAPPRRSSTCSASCCTRPTPTWSCR